jgi:hypothetical protein
MGGKPEISILLVGAEYLADKLLVGEGSGLAAGIGEKVKEAYAGRFDLDVVPQPLGSTAPAWMDEADPAASTVAAPGRLFERSWDVVAFSLEPEITRPLWRHRDSRRAFSAPEQGGREEAAHGHEPLGMLSVQAYKTGFSRCIAAIKARMGAHVIVFNCFTYDPHDGADNHHGIPETRAYRALAFNLALIELSMEHGISIIDVDRILAELGGAAHVSEAFRYSTPAREAIRDEFVRVLQDIGFFENRPLVMQVGRKRA